MIYSSPIVVRGKSLWDTEAYRWTSNLASIYQITVMW